MRKFLLGLVVGVIIAVVGIFVVLLAVGRLFSPKQPVVEANSALVLSLSGDLPEAAPVEIPLPFIESQATPTIRDLWTSLREAAKDARIKALVLEPHGLAIGWAKLQEVHQELEDFKKSGKPVYAVLHSPGSREYYLASAADKIYLSPEDMLDVKGFRLESMYFKDTLDKFGIEMQVDHIGRYKDAGDVFTRTGMTPETREVLNQVLDQIYGDFCTTVGSGRKKSADAVRALIDLGPFQADQAKTNGLIDEVGYEDQAYSDLKKKTGLSDLKKLSIKRYFRAVPARGDNIAFLVGAGEISSGESEPLNNESGIASRTFIRTIRQVRNDKSVKGVIVRVDSPGGDSTASDEILHELKLLSAAKPVIVSMSDLAASGGYYISVTGDPIVSYPDTITGSIGVLYLRPNVRGLYQKLGVQTEEITRGKLADLDSESTPLSDAAKQKLHDSIMATYQAFVTKVASARKRSFDQVDAIGQGRVWMGAQALTNGLVDQLGGLDKAVALIRERAKLSTAGDTNLVVYPPQRSLLEILTSTSTEEYTSEMAARTVRKALPNLPSASILRGGMLRILPYRLQIQ